MMARLHLYGLSYLSPLLVLCKYLGIFSPYHKGTGYKIYVAFLMAFSLLGSLASTIDKQNMQEMENYPTIIKLIDHIANAFLTTLTVASSLLAVFVHPKKMSKLFKDIYVVDGSLRASYVKFKKAFWCVFILYNLMEIGALIMDTFYWLTTISIRRYAPYFVRNMQYYQLSIQLFLMATTAMEISHRFRLLNVQLQGSVKTVTNLNFWYSLQTKNYNSKRTINDDMKRIMKCHSTLCDLIDLYSDIFKFSYMFYVVFTIAYIIHYTILLIYYTIFAKLLDGISFGLRLQIVCCLWILENCVSI